MCGVNLRAAFFGDRQIRRRGGRVFKFNYEINLRDPAFGISPFGSPYLSVNLCSVLGSRDWTSCVFKI